MKNRSIAIVALLLTTTSTTVAGAMPQESGTCPNKKASQVDSETKPQGGSERCGLGVSLFGWGIGLFGPKCPDKKATYPAHQVCKGEENMGTRCVKQSDLRVTLEECTCSVAGILGTGLALPNCSCSASGQDGGTVEDFETQNCTPDV
ncbi:MAG: hypothetical protein EXS08_08930 [Planctomycetes bacterium]|nr:hypothetical protein [Planctomycetota bacterium]